MTVVFPVH